MPSPLDLQPAQCQGRGKVRASGNERFSDSPHRIFLSYLLLSMLCSSCGVVGSGPASAPAPAPAPAPTPSVTVTPNSAQPFTGDDVQFTAVVQNAPSSTVIWQVNQTPSGNQTVGTISATGYYTAPNSVPRPATVTVTAVLQANPSVSGSASVTIQSLSSIQGPLTLSPSLASVTVSQQLQVSVLTPGVSNNDVNWSVSNGTISATGLFSPPPVAGSYLIRAVLQANPSAVGTATVEVTNFPGTLTWRNDSSRSGVNSLELALAPATVSSTTFGKLFSCPIDGYAYAQPLYVPNLAIPGNGTHNVVFVATEKDSVFAFDADANPCVKLWQQSLIPSGSQAIATPNLSIASPDIVPFIGITGTPVINLSTSALYVVAVTQTAGVDSAYNQRIYALDLATGQPKIQAIGAEIASPALQPSTFNALLENQRAALLLDNGIVYIAFGSHGGQGDYHGWLFGYDSTTLQQTGAFNVTPNAIQGGIWQSGGGPSADSNHNIFVVTGDGPFDANRGGESYSDSFLRLAASGGLSLSDYFTPCDQAADQSAGQDVGSSAPVLLPDSAGSVLQPHLLLGGAKNGSLYIVNRDNLGEFSGACPDPTTRVQTVPVGDGSILNTPLFWNSAVYVAAGNGKLKAFPVVGGILSSSPFTSQSPETLGPQGATPAISANATSNAILWLIDTSGALTTPNGPAILRAYDPSNLSNEIYNSATVVPRDTAGAAVKFTVPTVANGKVYVGTQTELDVYGLLN